MEEKIEVKSEDEEVIKEETELEKEVDPSKALKSWFKKKPEEIEKEEGPKKRPINWIKSHLIFVHVLALLVLVTSIGANLCLYKKYKAAKNKPAETVCVSQESNSLDKEKIDKMAEQVDKLSTILATNGNTQNTSNVSSENNQNILKLALASPTEAEKTGGAIKVAIYNGTTTAGLAKEMETTLKAKLAEAEVVALDNAKHSNYTKTLVMAIGGKVPEAQKVAQAIGAQFSIFPLDENKPDADVLVVVGK